MIFIIDKKTQYYKQKIDHNPLDVYLFQRKVLEDTALLPSTRCVAIELLHHVNNQKDSPNYGRCDPDQPRLAEKLGLNKRTVQRAISELKERGWLIVQRRFNGSNVYKFNFDLDTTQMSHRRDDTDVVNVTTQMSSPTRHARRQRDDTDVVLTYELNNDKEHEKRTLLSERETSSSDERSLHKSEGSSDETFLRRSETASDEKKLQEVEASGAIAADAFARFWQVYPKREGEVSARRAFAKAVEKVDPELLIRAAEVYAHHRDGMKPPHMFASASNWLIGERWTDEYQPSGSNRGSAQLPPVTPISSPTTRRCQQCRGTFATNNTGLEFYCDDCTKDIHEEMGGELQRCNEEYRERIAAAQEYFPNNDLY